MLPHEEFWQTDQYFPSYALNSASGCFRAGGGGNPIISFFLLQELTSIFCHPTLQIYSLLPLHSVCLLGQNCSSYTANFTLGGLEGEEEVIHPYLFFHCTCGPQPFVILLYRYTACSRSTPFVSRVKTARAMAEIVTLGRLEGEEEVIHPYLFFHCTS
jgi:hypothetical protein